jgi:putative ABC transport system ATP-binding protein
LSSTEPTVAVRCRNLVKEFGEGETKVRALRGLDLDIYCGELTLLVGPSGCGKTTLLSTIVGLLDPTSGQLDVFDHDMANMSGAQKQRFRRQQVGFVFQQYNLLPALTAAENVIVPLIIAGWSRRQALPRAYELLDQLRLSKRATAFPGTLSGGEQQRVAIARALVHQPQLLVCDEPTSALDHQTGHKIMELIHEAAVAPGRAVIVVTHDNRIFEFGDRMARMDDGRILEVMRKGGLRQAADQALAREH